jgi:hypothetical protein
MTIAMEINRDLLSREEAAVVRVVTTHLQRRMRLPDRTLEQAIQFGLPVPVADRVSYKSPGPWNLENTAQGFDNFAPPKHFQIAYFNTLHRRMVDLLTSYTEEFHTTISQAFHAMNTNPISHTQIRQAVKDPSGYKYLRTAATLNNIARKTNITDENPVEALHNVIMSAPRFPKKQFLYRGINPVKDRRSEVQGMCGLLEPGQLIVCHRQSSTSYDYFTSYGFAGLLMFLIEVPPNFPFLDLCHNPRFSNNDEMEVVLPARMILEVTHFTPLDRFVPIAKHHDQLCPFMIHTRAVGICEPFLQPTISNEVRFEMAFSPVMKNQLVWNI